MKRSASTGRIEYGRIIWARVADRNGFVKERPAIIVSDPADAHAGTPLVIVAITTTFSDPLPEWHVLLPWNRDGRRVMTQLSSRSAAVVGWFDTVDRHDVIEVRGTVPAKQMGRIEELMRLWYAAKEMDGNQSDLD
ncbi:MAG: type II toxin-antitoxin system PemK/MazF family toxin [Burkholderiales bacterium]|nr:type II toxin-antitoxin system PemK/MazF family toxin [Phycisphaerae bacterium]